MFLKASSNRADPPGEYFLNNGASIFSSANVNSTGEKPSKMPRSYTKEDEKETAPKPSFADKNSSRRVPLTAAWALLAENSCVYMSDDEQKAAAFSSPQPTKLYVSGKPASTKTIARARSFSKKGSDSDDALVVLKPSPPGVGPCAKGDTDNRSKLQKRKSSRLENRRIDAETPSDSQRQRQKGKPASPVPFDEVKPKSMEATLEEKRATPFEEMIQKPFEISEEAARRVGFALRKASFSSFLGYSCGDSDAVDEDHEDEIEQIPASKDKSKSTNGQSLKAVKEMDDAIDMASDNEPGLERTLSDASFDGKTHQHSWRTSMFRKGPRVTNIQRSSTAPPNEMSSKPSFRLQPLFLRSNNSTRTTNDAQVLEIVEKDAVEVVYKPPALLSRIVKRVHSINPKTVNANSGGVACEDKRSLKTRSASRGWVSSALSEEEEILVAVNSPPHSQSTKTDLVVQERPTADITSSGNKDMSRDHTNDSVLHKAPRGNNTNEDKDGSFQTLSRFCQSTNTNNAGGVQIIELANLSRISNWFFPPCTAPTIDVNNITEGEKEMWVKPDDKCAEIQPQVSTSSTAEVTSQEGASDTDLAKPKAVKGKKKTKKTKAEKKSSSQKKLLRKKPSFTR
ncbi:hypothetical protein ACA910_004027 [Epithemia clementina (nom. ined.)]